MRFTVVGTSLTLPVDGNVVATAADAHVQGAGGVGSYSSPGSSIWPAQAGA